jgi:hypothetical protein
MHLWVRCHTASQFLALEQTIAPLREIPTSSCRWRVSTNQRAVPALIYANCAHDAKVQRQRCTPLSSRLNFRYTTTCAFYRPLPSDQGLSHLRATPLRPFPVSHAAVGATISRPDELDYLGALSQVRVRYLCPRRPISPFTWGSPQPNRLSLGAMQWRNNPLSPPPRPRKATTASEPDGIHPSSLSPGVRC